jgi:hypothetical protein
MPNFIDLTDIAAPIKVSRDEESLINPEIVNFCWAFAVEKVNKMMQNKTNLNFI